jgi:1-acyl-sn-glycerol-3-phosphate acyltransferase
MEPRSPRPNALGRLLPLCWQDALLRRATSLDLPAVLADLLLTYPDDGTALDPALTRRMFYLLEQTICRYFRLHVLGTDHIPAGRALLIGCHSGVLPWDAACLITAVYTHTGRLSRNAAHRLFGAIPAVERFLAACGGVVMGEQGDLEALLRRDELVLLFPGGAEDMRRPIWDRYHVRAHKGFAPGRGGYIRLALRTGSPIVPVAIVGAEEIHVMLTDVPALARLVRLPYFPIVLSPCPLPARMYIRFGPPIRLDAPPEAAADQAVVDRLNADVRRRLQALIDDTVRHRRGIYWSSYAGGAS